MSGLYTRKLYSLVLLTVIALIWLSFDASAATDGSRFNPADFAPLGAITVTTGAVSFNTTTGVSSYGTGTLTTTQGGRPVTVWCFNSISITGTATITVTGTRGFVLLSRGGIVLGASADINGNAPAASGTTAGAGVLGGSNGGAANAAGVGLGAGGVVGSDAGSGAGYGGMGGAGAANNTSGRATYGQTTLYDLYGGSGGGGGGSGGNSGSGGGGGGAIALCAVTSITINAGCVISVNGGTGAYATRFPGGGGSGGSILLSAPTVTNGGTLQVSGGNGGGATQNNREGAGGGGGGRIAIYADSVTAGTCNVAGGTAGPAPGGGGDAGDPGSAGTVYTGFFTTPPAVSSVTRLDSTPTNASSVDYRVVFSMAVTGVQLSDFTLTASGLSGATVTGFSGSGTTYDVSVSTGSGEGTLRLDILDFDTILGPGGLPLGGTGSGNGTFTSGEVYTIDTVAPTVSLSGPSVGATRVGPVTYTVTYTGASTVNLPLSSVHLVASGTATGTVAVSGTGSASRTITISGISGDGTLAVSIDPGTGTDAVGNACGGAGPSTEVVVDNTPPGISISPPSSTITTTGPVTYTVTYTGASSVSLVAGNVTLNRTGTAWGTVTVSGSGSDSRTVQISSITGDGSLWISIAAGTASDGAGNTAPGAGPSDVFTVTNTGISVSIGAPSVSLTRSGPVEFEVSYNGATNVTLSPADVTLNKGAGTATGTIAVTGGGNKKRTVTISGITGDGPLGISIAAGTATSPPSFSAPAAGPSATCMVDNTPPTFTVIPPDGLQTCGTENIKWQVSFDDAAPCVMNDSFILIDLTGTLTGDFSVVAAGDQTRNVFVKNVQGIGTAVLTIAAGAAIDEAGNESAAWGPSEAVFANGDPPPITVTGPSLALTNTGPVTYQVSYENATSVTLSASNITLNRTGTANAQISVSGSGLDERTVTLSNITGDGMLGISISAGTASDTCGQLSAAYGPSDTFTVDNTGPAIVVGPPSATITRGGPITYTVTYTDAAAITLAAGNVSLSTTGTANGSIGVSGGGMTTRTVTVSGVTGDGTLAIVIAAGTATDSLGNPSLQAGPSIPFTVDNTPPSVSLSGPSATLTRTGPVTYTVSFTGADSVLLAPGLVMLNKTGSANGTVNVLGSLLTERTVEITGISGTGTLGISISAGSATDLAGNSAAACGPSVTFEVDNTPPEVTIGAPSGSPTRSGPATYTVSYSGASAVTLADTDLLVTTTGTASATATVSGSGSTTRTVTFTGATGDGEISFSIQPGTAVDLAGNVAGAGGPSQAFTVDNTAPTVELGDPSPEITRNGPVTSVVSYTDATGIVLTAADVTVQTTGTASADVSVAGSGAEERTVTFSNASGNGTISYSIGANTGLDAAGNFAEAAGPSAVFTVDNAPPTISIGAPSSTVTSRGPVSFTVTYTGADEISLSPADITLVKTGTANGVVTVGGSGTAQRSVTVQNIVGNGTIAIQVAAGSAQDEVGNAAPSAGPSASFTVNNEAISVSIGAPSAYLTRHGPVTLPVTYDNALSVNLTRDDVSLNTTGTAHATVAVSGSGLTERTVTLSSISGNGTISISIDAGTGLDDVGEPAPAAGPSASITVDNTPPTVSLNAPSVTLTRMGPVDFEVEYNGSSEITLEPGDVSLEKTGTADATVGVSVSGANKRKVTLSDITGDGMLWIVIASGTARDEAGNLSPLAGPSAVVAVDNISPVVTIGPPAPGLTRTGPVSWTVDFGDAETVSLDASRVTLVKTGTADGVAVVTGSGGSSRTVTLYNAVGDGTIALSIAAGSAEDAAGNTTAATGPSAPARVDNLAPVITMLGEPLVEIEYTLPYADAGATAVDNVDGVITSRINVANYVDTQVPGTYTVSYNVSDAAGNPAQTLVRTVQVVKTTTEQIILELLGGTLCRPGICVTINPNRVFTPAGAWRLVIDRPMMSLFPPDLLAGVVPGSWFDLKPNWLAALDMGSIRLYYEDEDQDGFIDGTEADELELFLYFLDPATGEVLTSEGTVQWIDNYLEAPITRFGVYALGVPVKEEYIPWDPEGEVPASGVPGLVVCGLMLAMTGYVALRRGRGVFVPVKGDERS